ncbi:hypothetical protein DIPPA_35689 [Diplonema papillatum]|nr:hypothetical protein DIPPA_35689 [Diplonema papillatum]
MPFYAQGDVCVDVYGNTVPRGYSVTPPRVDAGGWGASPKEDGGPLQMLFPVLISSPQATQAYSYRKGRIAGLNEARRLPARAAGGDDSRDAYADEAQYHPTASSHPRKHVSISVVPSPIRRDGVRSVHSGASYHSHPAHSTTARSPARREPGMADLLHELEAMKEQLLELRAETERPATVVVRHAGTPHGSADSPPPETVYRQAAAGPPRSTTWNSLIDDGWDSYQGYPSDPEQEPQRRRRSSSSRASSTRSSTPRKQSRHKGGGGSRGKSSSKQKKQQSQQRPPRDEGYHEAAPKRYEKTMFSAPRAAQSSDEATAHSARRNDKRHSHHRPPSSPLQVKTRVDPGTPPASSKAPRSSPVFSDSDWDRTPDKWHPVHRDDSPEWPARSKRSGRYLVYSA